MKSIGNLKINKILELMLIISVTTMILISGFVWIITARIIDMHEAKLFISRSVSIPGNTMHIFIFTVISSICFILTFSVRSSNRLNDTYIIFVTFIIEFILELICIILLNFNYNGILLWTFANALIYLKKNKYISIVIVAATVSYLFTTHDLVKLFINIYDISAYIRVCRQLYFLYTIHLI